MRKNINKLVAVAIGVSVMSGSLVPVFAADTTTQNTSATKNVQAQTIGKSLFTLENAIKAAESNSETLKLDDQKISYQGKIDDINEKSDDFNEVSGDKEDFNEDTRDVTLKKLKQQRDFDEDVLIQKTTTAYNSIVTSQKKIDKAERNLEIKNKELNDTNLRKNLGLITSIDLKTTELNIESLKNQQKSSENTLKDAQDSFKVLTGKDVTQYTLEQDIKYEEFKIDGSVDVYLDNAIDNYLKYSTELLKLNKDYLKDNVVSEPTDSDKPSDTLPPKPDLTTISMDDYDKYEAAVAKYNGNMQAYAGKLSGRLAYLNAKLSTYEGETTLSESKKKFKDSLRGMYTNLLTTSDSINLLKKNIELNNKQLSNAKLRYDLGMTTKSEYNTQVVNSQDLELQLRSAIDSYNTLKENIQKPWIAFS